MTAPEPMSRTELIELAALDALGLLDEYEALLYTRSFHHASASVQEEILDLQAQIVTQVGSMVDEEPPAVLRERVLRAVSEAVELDSPAPLANISRLARSKGAEMPEPEPEGPYAFPSSRRTTLASQFWRAACFVLVGVVAVMVYNLIQAQSFNQDVTMAALNDNTRKQIEQLIGPTVKTYLANPSTVRVVLNSQNDTCTNCWANLMFFEGDDEALLLTDGLPALAPGETYQLRVRVEGGETKTVMHVAAGVLLGGQRIRLDTATLMAASSWEIVGPNGVMLSGSRA